MRKYRHRWNWVWGLIVVFAAVARGDYPIMSHRYLADPAVLVTDDRVYVYCSNDDDSPVNGSYVIKNVVCVSTSDMKNWTDHGIVFEPEKETKWAKKSWAPAAIKRDGTYFLYFGNGGANIGVVTSKNPTGPFVDPRGSNLIDSKTPGVLPAEKMWLFDPGVFIDDDGQAYLFFGGNGDNNCRVVKLNKDMISLDGPAKQITIPNFFEAAWMHKRNGKYYLSYSTNPKAGLRIDYMISDKPTEGFEYGGIVADQPPINNNNNHAAEFEFKGKWYHIYHNRIVAKEAGIPTGFRRNLAMEELTYEPDNKIKKVTYSIDGVKQTGNLNPYFKIQAETFSAQLGVETDKIDSENMKLTEIENGDWISVKGVDFGNKGPTQFSVNATRASIGSKIEIHLDRIDGPVVGTCLIEKNNADQPWTQYMTSISGATGVHDLFLTFSGTESKLFELDYWMFK